MDDLVSLLAQDVVVYGDSGGTRPSWPRPVAGREKVARLPAGVGRQAREYGLRIELTEVNGQPGAAFYDPEGGLKNVFCLEIADGVVQIIRGVINPAKLAHLGPLTRLRETRGRS